MHTHPLVFILLAAADAVTTTFCFLTVFGLFFLSLVILEERKTKVFNNKLPSPSVHHHPQKK